MKRQVRNDQRDRLGVLILNKRQQVGRLSLLQKGKWRLAHLLADLLKNSLGIACRQRLEQQRTRVFQAALTGPTVRDGEIVKLFQDLVA